MSNQTSLWKILIENAFCYILFYIIIASLKYGLVMKLFIKCLKEIRMICFVVDNHAHVSLASYIFRYIPCHKEKKSTWTAIETWAWLTMSLQLYLAVTQQIQSIMSIFILANNKHRIIVLMLYFQIQIWFYVYKNNN